jgi:hypothetical protein
VLESTPAKCEALFYNCNAFAGLNQFMQSICLIDELSRVTYLLVFIAFVIRPRVAGPAPMKATSARRIFFDPLLLMGEQRTII